MSDTIICYSICYTLLHVHTIFNKKYLVIRMSVICCIGCGCSLLNFVISKDNIK